MTSFIHFRAAGYSIRVDVALELYRADRLSTELEERAIKLEETLQKIALLVIDRHVALESQRVERLVNLMLNGQGPTPINITKARVKATSKRAVFEGTEWLTAAQLWELAGLGLADRSGTVNCWKQRRRIFALHHHGQDLYPRYLFDDDFRPIEGIEKILEALASFSAWRLASWFESPSALLAGRRPREVLESDSERVGVAARRTLDSELYAA